MCEHPEQAIEIREVEDMMNQEDKTSYITAYVCAICGQMLGVAPELGEREE